MNTAMRFIPRRLLVTVDTVRGCWTYSMELARALRPHGVQIVLATMGAPSNRAQQTEAARLDNVKLIESACKLEWMTDPWDDVVRAGEWLLELEEVFQPDIVHLNGYSHGALPWRAPKIVVGHSCVLSWWRAVKGCDAPEEWKTYQAMVTEGLQLADFVVAPSRAMLKALNDHYGPFAAATVIPNGRRVKVDAQCAKQNFILAAGRLWDEAKNIAALTRIAPRLPWPVYLGGDATYPVSVKSKPTSAPKSGRSRRVSVARTKAHSSRPARAGASWLGQLAPNELQVWFNQTAIYVSPARYEPFGLSVVEAALSGCALVLGDIPSLRENWNHAALFVPPEDPGALETALKQLISNPDLRAELAARSRRTAERFTPESMADGYLSAYHVAYERNRLKRSASVPQPMLDMRRPEFDTPALQQ